MNKKVANNVSPKMHKEVEKHITDKDGLRWRVQQSQLSFLIAKKLLRDLPIVPTNERVYELAQDIVIGSFEDISTVEDAELENNWQLWIERTHELLISKGILIASNSRLRKKEAEVLIDYYEEAEKTMKFVKEKKELINIIDSTNNTEYILALLDTALNKSIINKEESKQLEDKALSDIL